MRTLITKRDKEIFNIMANSGKPMSAADIVDSMPSLTKNTVQAELRKLLKNGFINIDSIGYSRTTLCRKYILTEKAQTYMINQISADYKQWIGNLSASSFVSHLWANEDDTKKISQDIEDLEELITNYKEKCDKESQ